MQAKRRENAKLYQEKNEQKSPAAPCREWRGTGRRMISLESGFGRLASERGGAGRRRGRSVAGDAAHAEGGADGGEHGRSEVPEELDEALAVFRGHGWGLLSVWGSDIGFLSVQLRQRAPRRLRPRSWP